MDRRRLMALGLGVGVTGLLIAGLVAVSGMTGSRPTSQSGGAIETGLEFRNVEVAARLDDSGTQRVSYDLAWVGDTFPGRLRCTLEALDSDGVVVGTYSTLFTSLRPLATGLYHDVRVSAPAVAGRGSCEGQRLDSAGPYEYDFTKVTASVSREGSVEVSFEGTWRGAGEPGVVTCSVEVLDSAGNVVGSQETNILLASGSESGRLTLELADVAEGTQLGGARFTGCSPFFA